VSHGFDYDEILDLVDENDQVIDHIARGKFLESTDESLGYIRGSAAFIINSHGELWVPRRANDRHVMPGGLDFSVAETVGSGESYDEAVVRGFAEEANLTISIEDLQNIGMLSPEDTVKFFINVYIYKSDAVPDYNRDDYTDYKWMKPQELLELLSPGKDFGKNGLIPAIKKFLL
jgi:isopentenyl-diphosphate delta-isomerase